jgi:CubicO group peptidase (beta-lactamase class C family)
MTLDLPRSTPEAQGVSSAALRRLFAALAGADSLHGVVILRHGHVIADASWAPYDPETPQHVYSISKSFTSAAVGLAIDEGLFGLDDALVELFPDDAPAVIDERLASLRVRHLLTMTTGHEGDTTDALFEAGDGSWVRAFLELPLVNDPGSTFFYNTGASYVLSALVQARSGERLLDYLTPRLLEPLGIVGASWQQSPHGVDFGGFGLFVRTRDIAAFGQLLLQRGRWGDRQLLPEAWVDAATAFQVPNAENDMDDDWQQGYGFQFWRSSHGYRGDGAFGQYCLVVPELDLVLAGTGSILRMEIPLYPVWSFLGTLSDVALAENPDAVAGLAADVARLAVPVPGGAAVSRGAARAADIRFALDENEHGLTSLTVRPGPDGSTLSIETGDRSFELAVGQLDWHTSTVPLWPDEGGRFAARGAWVAERQFRARIVSLGGPTTLDLTLTVGAAFDSIELTLLQHVSFGPIVPVVVRGRA